MPLSMIPIGDSVQIDSIRGKEETRHFLERLGFVPGTEVCIVSESNGDVIVKLRDTRVAISRAMASKIFVAVGKEREGDSCEA